MIPRPSTLWAAMRVAGRTIAAISLLLVLFSAPSAYAQTSFNAWLHQFKQDARAQGISDATLTSAFANVTPSQRVIELDGKQPERKIGFAEYRKRTITPDRVAQGQRLLRENWSLLKRVEQEFGVQAQYIVALWGIETSYGKNTGGFDLIQALATLAWEGRRGAYFRAELIQALKILQDGHISRDRFKGSWAGAMGQNQFMPTSWKRFAVDYNGDGHKDIWTTRPDIFASSANYLATNGWKRGERWGREIQLPQNFSRSLAGTDVQKSLTAWSQMGVRASDGSALPQDGSLYASVVIPDGANGKAYLVYKNYRTIMTWNRSTYFALSVGMLADAIAQGSGARPPKPSHPNE